VTVRTCLAMSTLAVAALLPKQWQREVLFGEELVPTPWQEIAVTPTTAAVAARMDDEDKSKDTHTPKDAADMNKLSG
jgi:hypothetical protein